MTVLGKSGHYEKVANALGANYLNIKNWDELAKAGKFDELWKINQDFLDQVISRGDDIILSDSVKAARQGSFFRRELDYLFSKGYELSEDGRRLIRPQ